MLLPEPLLFDVEISFIEQIWIKHRISELEPDANNSFHIMLIATHKSLFLTCAIIYILRKNISLSWD